MRQQFAAVAFRALRAILYPTRGSRKRPRPDVVRRLLVVNRLRIGDSIVTTPFLSVLRAQLPSAEITLLVQSPIEELFLEDPRVDVLVRRPLKGRLEAVRGRWAPGFDAAVILDPTLRSGWIARRARSRWAAGYDSHSRGVFLDARLPAPPYWNRPLREYRGKVLPLHQTRAWMALGPLLGLIPEERAPWLAVPDADKAWASERLASATGKGPLIALHPGSDVSYRWPADRWAALAKSLKDARDARLLVTGGPGDRELAAGIPALNLAGETTLARMAALIGACDALVSVDTCATHMASAMGTPCVALFGPGDPDIWRPYGEGHIVLQAENPPPCLGCKRPFCSLVEDGGRHECMEGISVARVREAVAELLRQGRPKGPGAS